MAPCETCELGLNDPESEKKLEDTASKKQKVLAQVKRVDPCQWPGIKVSFST
jgi:hypothetical protein